MLAATATRRSAPRHYLGLDAIRLCAAMMVVLYHLAYLRWRPDHATDPSFRAAFQPLKYFVSSGWVGVPIFFVISGFVIAFVSEGQSAGQFIRNRASRLYPPAWLCATLTALIAGATLNQYIRSMALFPIGPWVDGVYWTLAIEISFYGLVVLAMAARIPLVSLAMGLGAYSIFFWAAKVANSIAGEPLDALFGAIENNEGYLLLAHDGIFFAFGMLFWLKRRTWAMLLFGSVGFLAILVRSRAITPADAAPFYVPPLIWLLATLLVVASVLYADAIDRRVGHYRRLFQILGLMTYPLYLVHQEVGISIMQSSRALGPWGALAVGLAATVALSLAILPVEERIRAIWRRQFPELRPTRAPA